MKPRRAAPYAAILCAGLLLAACVETGDFGRPRPTLWNDLALPTTGSLAAYVRAEPVSFYPLTDDEQELRRRAWRFLMPAYERSWFERQIAELARNRILPVWLQPRDRAIYFRALMRDSGPSPASRYRRVSEDAVADAKLIDAFAITAARVVQADEARIKSLAWTADLAAGEVREAAARVAENRCLIAWVRFEVEVRRESYRYALEHLFIEAPQPEGAAVERTLAKLDAHRSAIDTLPGGPWEVSSCGLPPTAIARLAAVEPIAIVAKD